jgi:lipoyl(octanoyl) transferase
MSISSAMSPEPESGNAVKPVICRLLGRIGYKEATVLQESYVKNIALGKEREQFLLLEHPHVITLGRGFHPENLLFSPESLRAQGIAVEESGRGGDITYHGPGQIVGYPLLNLSAKPDLHLYLRNLEELMIRCLSDFGITAARKQRLTGVWVGDEKIGAIGVRVTRWVTSHGFALNVNTDLRFFQYIVPCGIREHGVTSMHVLLGRGIPEEEVSASLQKHFQIIFNRKLVE